ncbi:hypothetical protein DI09_185p20 [Mitosporidium daphniae]|uniref:Uncharacterized protein n=1 Tax=Mitosporidium daphniae TaxID=1485682 RepID=A0A098VTS0_9MICR|nr:uncharacterized protein DI09_185p20 [Mitosporidium daphniae]KGG52347.1 hypothetical protein DI09_185p20 [Mitosporidium daphniae]|eukprot:XP_013238783.1 uncharacterized protein DI09_185p20 [Mitosporidium daphniae]
MAHGQLRQENEGHFDDVCTEEKSGIKIIEADHGETTRSINGAENHEKNVRTVNIGISNLSSRGMALSAYVIQTIHGYQTRKIKAKNNTDTRQVARMKSAKWFCVRARREAVEDKTSSKGRNKTGQSSRASVPS